VRGKPLSDVPGVEFCAAVDVGAVPLHDYGKLQRWTHQSVKCELQSAK
jgi:hypothetical protein